MTQFRHHVYPVLVNGSPLLVTPIGDQPITTFLVDLEQFFILLEKHTDPDGVTFWTEFGKGKTNLSAQIGFAIEQVNRNTWPSI